LETILEQGQGNYFSNIGKKGGQRSGQVRRERYGIQKLAKSVLDTKFKPNQNLKKALKGIGIDVSDNISLLNGILAVFSGKALSGDIVAAKFVFDIAGYTLNSQERAAKIKLLQKMAEPERGDEIVEKPKMDLVEIDRQARELGIYGD
jgi:hypothetical protein